MIPARFVYEYPARCLELIETMEAEAHRRHLVGSFSLLVAPSLFLIPYERMKEQHPIREHEREPEIYAAMKRIRSQKFLDADFWAGQRKESWRLTRIVSRVNKTGNWRDENGLFPFDSNAQNRISNSSVNKIIRVIRNALAHGNIVYVNESGFEQHGTKLQFLCFLSRFEESNEDRRKSETYYLLSVAEEEFLGFLKAWAAWLGSHQMDSRIQEAA